MTKAYYKAIASGTNLAHMTIAKVDIMEDRSYQKFVKKIKTYVEGGRKVVIEVVEEEV